MIVSGEGWHAMYRWHMSAHGAAIGIDDPGFMGDPTQDGDKTETTPVVLWQEDEAGRVFGLIAGIDGHLFRAEEWPAFAGYSDEPRNTYTGAWSCCKREGPHCSGWLSAPNDKGTAS